MRYKNRLRRVTTLILDIANPHFDSARYGLQSQHKSLRTRCEVSSRDKMLKRARNLPTYPLDLEIARHESPLQTFLDRSRPLTVRDNFALPTNTAQLYVSFLRNWFMVRFDIYKSILRAAVSKPLSPFWSTTPVKGFA
jgi:hypothetical protein